MRSIVLFSSDISIPHRPRPLQGDNEGLMARMPSQKKMLIDALPPLSPRPEQMEVLAMGFARTGTMCMYNAV